MLAPALVAPPVGCAPAQSRSTSPPSASVAADDQLMRDEGLYRANCQACHGDALTGEGGLPGAPILGANGHTWHHLERNLTGIILDSSGAMGEMRDRMDIRPDTPRMPAWRGKLSDEEIATILAYIAAGWSPEQQRFQHETPMMQ